METKLDVEITKTEYICDEAFVNGAKRLAKKLDQTENCISTVNGKTHNMETNSIYHDLSYVFRINSEQPEATFQNNGGTKNLNNIPCIKEHFVDNDSLDGMEAKSDIEVSKTEYIYDEAVVNAAKRLDDISNTNDSPQKQTIDNDYTIDLLTEFVCEFCFKAFGQLHHLKSHLGVHSDEYKKMVHMERNLNNSDNHKKLKKNAVNDVIATNTVFKDLSNGTKNNGGQVEDDNIEERNQNPKSSVKKPTQLGNQCAVCKKIFNFHRDLIKHAQQYHTKSKAFKCKDCSFVSNNTTNLLRHSKIHKTLPRKFICKFCSKSFRTLEKLNFHSSDHTGARPYSCKLCNKTFEHKNSLRIHLCTHMEKKVNDKSYISKKSNACADKGLKKRNNCDICGKSYSTLFSLKRHLLQLHNSNYKKKKKTIKKRIRPKNHLCEYCPKAFRKSSDLIIHIRRHTGERPFPCSLCSKSFDRKHSLQVHLRSHSSVFVTCTICNKSLKNDIGLRKHLNVHSEERPYSCSFCSKSFKQNYQLTRHLLIHNEKRAFSCPVCEKSFKYKSYLKIHEQYHLKWKSNEHSCEVCKKSFDTPYHLRIHLRIHKARHICEVCNKSFYQLYHLKIHLSTHSEERPYSCSICEKSFKDKSTLRNHLRGHLKQASDNLTPSNEKNNSLPSKSPDQNA